MFLYMFKSNFSMRVLRRRTHGAVPEPAPAERTRALERRCAMFRYPRHGTISTRWGRRAAQTRQCVTYTRSDADAFHRLPRTDSRAGERQPIPGPMCWRAYPSHPRPVERCPFHAAWAFEPFDAI